MKFHSKLLVAAAVLALAACDKQAPTPAATPSTGNTAAVGQAAPKKVAARADDNNVYKVPLDDSPVKGDNAAPVTIVEFSDYQCPFCSRAHATVKQLEDTYGNKIRVVMKQNPLPFHNRAKPAATAALAALEQGQDKFWKMHDTLFANQKALEDANLEDYARQSGLDLDKWKASLADPKLAKIIERDQAEAQKLGASGTPSFFINGRKMVGAQPVENFQALIDEEINKANQMVQSGVAPDQVYAKIQEKGIDAAPAAPQRQAPPAAVVKKIDIPAEAPVKGPKTAKVTIVEWSDFQCPFCGRVEGTLKQIQDQYGKDVRIVWRNQPLPFHQNAKPAAEAAMAAHEQGKFWEMHDKLFSNQQALDADSLKRYASEIGLNAGKFQSAIDSHKFAAQIDKDSQEGTAAGANGTPTFFINGRQLVGAQPFEQFKAVIDEEIKKADKLLADGVKPDQLYTKISEQNVAAAPAQPQPGPPQPPPVQKIEVGNAPVKGPKNAPVTIVEFSDFQCPFCSRAVGTIKQIEETYGNKVKIAFKMQPLPFHQNARPAAMAALAAQEQGKFWEMHDKLFANQQALDRPSLDRYAQEIGLDMNKYKAAMDSNKFESTITADQAEAGRVGANGTPTFYINGRQLVGAQPFESFKAVIDEELKKSGK